MMALHNLSFSHQLASCTLLQYRQAKAGQHTGGAGAHQKTSGRNTPSAVMSTRAMGMGAGGHRIKTQEHSKYHTTSSNRVRHAVVPQQVSYLYIWCNLRNVDTSTCPTSTCRRFAGNVKHHNWNKLLLQYILVVLPSPLKASAPEFTDETGVAACPSPSVEKASSSDPLSPLCLIVACQHAKPEQNTCPLCEFQYEERLG